LAYNRLANIEKKMKRDGQFAQEYSRKEYVSKGYLERIAELKKDLERARGANTERADPTISSAVSASQPPFATYLTQKVWHQ